MGVFESEHDMCISIHALLAESDQTNGSTTIPNFNFYPRSPCGERPIGRRGRAARDNFYPRSPCGERPILGNPCAGCPAISIHALLAESDLFLRSDPMTRRYFYPRSPCGERQRLEVYKRRYLAISIHALLAESDLSSTDMRSHNRRFLSTLSLRRATQIRPFRMFIITISIHALLAESDSCLRVMPLLLPYFYPRSPCGERLVGR